MVSGTDKIIELVPGEVYTYNRNHRMQYVGPTMTSKGKKSVFVFLRLIDDYLIALKQNELTSLSLDQ